MGAVVGFFARAVEVRRIHRHGKQQRRYRKEGNELACARMTELVDHCGVYATAQAYTVTPLRTMATGGEVATLHRGYFSGFLGAFSVREKTTCLNHLPRSAGVRILGVSKPISLNPPHRSGTLWPQQRGSSGMAILIGN